MKLIPTLWKNHEISAESSVIFVEELLKRKHRVPQVNECIQSTFPASAIALLNFYTTL
jgi:hypothetical protein